MTHDGRSAFQYASDWDFEMFDIESECLTSWDLYSLLKEFTTADSRILDLGTGGGEKLLAFFPECSEITGTDLSAAMIGTARENLRKSGRQNITFKVMDNLRMDVPENYYDVVVARHTMTDPVQIRRCLKPGGHLLIRGVDKYDCWALKLLFKGGQGFDDPVPQSISDYERVLEAGFTDVELVPLHEREFFRSAEEFKAFLRKVPILDVTDDGLIDRYIRSNTFGGRIRLIRRYYGITATV